MKKHKSIFIGLFSIISFFISIGLACAFPLDSYALGSFSSPNSSNTFTITGNVYGGCLQKGYDIGAFANTNPDNSILIRKGANKVDTTTSSSDLYNCGYRVANGHMNYYQYSIAMTRNLVYTNGSVSTDTYATTGGSTNILNYNDNYNSVDYDIYNQLNSIDITINSQNDTAFRFPAYTEGDISDEINFAITMIALDMPNSASDMGNSLEIGANSFNASGATFTASELNNYATDSLVKFCSNDVSSSETYTNLLAPFNYEHTAPDGYTTCYILFNTPLSDFSYGFYNNRTFHITYAASSKYDRSVFTTSDGLVLPYYGYPWSGIFTSPSYKLMNAKSDNSFKFINPFVKIVWPETVEESQMVWGLHTSLTGLNHSTTSPNYDQNNSSSEYPSNSSVLSWFNVYDLSGFIFPFSDFYTNFVNPVNSCVSLSIIPAWLHLPNTTYCSWWPSYVVNTLTPVFTVIPMMILFGFIVSWLRGDRAYSVFHDADRGSR